MTVPQKELRAAAPEAADAPATRLLAELEALLQAGNGAGALQHCRVWIARHPARSEGHRHLSMLLMACGDAPAAERAAERACELSPIDARCWLDLGRVHAMQSRLGSAAQMFQRATALDPANAHAWHNLGVALRRLRQDDEAFRALKQALVLDSRNAASYLALGGLLVEAGQLDDALECYERAACHDPQLVRARSRLGWQLAARGRVRRAEKLFRDSLALDTGHLPGWLGLGSVLEDLGEADAALACYRNVLAREPRQAHALGRCLALLREPDAGAESAAQRLLADAGTSDEARSLIGYGLAKYHERQRDYGRAAAAGLAANAARRRASGPLDRAALVSRVDGIIATCTREFFAAHRQSGLGNDQPVFIVGLPRSGTTLTEQILSCHPLVHGAGELNDLARIAAQYAGEGAPWSAVTALDATASRAAANQYLAALRAGAERGRLRCIDKSPLNFFHLGFVALLFPNARVIHCQRGARDNALSIWMENFNARQTYATDFDDLAFFRAQYQRLMRHWREHLPLKMLECRYEETVRDLELQAHQLVDFLGLPWDGRCLQFHRSDRVVRTPSRWQVRQPVYSSAVERWRNYEPFLPELLAAFGVSDLPT